MFEILQNIIEFLFDSGFVYGLTTFGPGTLLPWMKDDTDNPLRRTSPPPFSTAPQTPFPTVGSGIFPVTGGGMFSGGAVPGGGGTSTSTFTSTTTPVNPFNLNLNRIGNRMQDMAYGTGLTPYRQAQQDALQRNYGFARQQAAGDAARSLDTTLGSMYARGGVGQGSRERLAGQNALNSLNRQQGMHQQYLGQQDQINAASAQDRMKYLDQMFGLGAQHSMMSTNQNDRLALAALQNQHRIGAENRAWQRGYPFLRDQYNWRNKWQTNFDNMLNKPVSQNVPSTAGINTWPVLR